MSAKALRETVAFLGVVASLVFVGLEIRQNTVVARASAQNELATAVREFALTIAGDAELQSIWSRWALGEPLEPLEQARATGLAQAYVATLENVFVQAELGVAERDVLQSYGFSGSLIPQTQNFRTFWAGYRNRVNPNFAAAFEAQYGLGP